MTGKKKNKKRLKKKKIRKKKTKNLSDFLISFLHLFLAFFPHNLSLLPRSLYNIVSLDPCDSFLPFHLISLFSFLFFFFFKKVLIDLVSVQSDSRNKWMSFFD
jgi:hypothetical protein